MCWKMILLSFQWSPSGDMRPFFLGGGWSNVLECSPQHPTILVAWLRRPKSSRVQEVLLYKHFSSCKRSTNTFFAVFLPPFPAIHMNRQIGTIDLHMANVYIYIYTHIHTLYNSIISLSLSIYIYIYTPTWWFPIFLERQFRPNIFVWKKSPLIRGRFPLLNASFFQCLRYPPTTAAWGSLRSQDQPGKRPLVVGKWKPLESFESLNGTHLENDLPNLHDYVPC